MNGPWIIVLAKLMLKARLEVFSHETTFETNQRQGGNLDLVARRIIGCRSVGGPATLG